MRNISALNLNYRFSAEQPQGGGDPFGMFGQMFGFGQQQEEVRRGQDIVVPLLVTLKEFILEL